MSYIAREEKADWGWPCTEDSQGVLRMGKKGNEIELVLSGDMVDSITSTLDSVRGDRRGRFWIKDRNTIVVVKHNDSHFLYMECDLNSGKEQEIYRQAMPNKKLSFV